MRATRAPLRVEVMDSAEALTPHITAWMRLATTAGQPYNLPGWQLTWWRHFAPPGARLRTLLVFDDRELVALAPFVLERGRAGHAEYRALATPFAPAPALAAPGVEHRVAPLLARALERADPTPSRVVFDGVHSTSEWPEALRRAWPGRLRPTRYVITKEPNPSLRIDAPDFDTWLACKSASFRQEMRKKRRRLERTGGAVRLASSGEPARQAISAFARLHFERFATRGGSHLPPTGLEQMLEEAAEALLPAGHLRLFAVELDGEVIGVQVALAAGDAISAWGVAFSSEHARLSPGVLAVLAMIEDAFARGERVVDLGSGRQEYKARLSENGDEGAAVFGGFLPVGPRYPRTRLGLLPAQLTSRARHAARRLPQERQEPIKRLVWQVRSRRRAP